MVLLLFIAQQTLLEDYHSLDLKTYGKRTNQSIRIKRLKQMIEMSEQREAQSVDLIIAKMEYDFFKAYIGLIELKPHLHTFSAVESAFCSEYLCECSDFMKKQLTTPVVYSNGCTTILPENQRVCIYANKN